MPKEAVSAGAKNEEDAEKMIKQGPRFFEDKASHAEGVGDQYCKAGRLYAIDKEWQKSGDAFCKSNTWYAKSQDPELADNTIFQASRSYRHGCTDDYLRTMDHVISSAAARGIFSRAGSYQQEVAAYYETEVKDLGMAMIEYDQAASFYAMEGNSILIGGCLEKAGQMAARTQQYEFAAQTFDKVGVEALKSPLSRIRFSGICLSAGLCHIAAGDIDAANKAISCYGIMDVSVHSTRDCCFLYAILEAVQENDVEKFIHCTSEYTVVVTLEQWKTQLLVHIKTLINSEDSLL
ncbi:soluble NSF attachment protein [Dissophora ornata]|nr:soluble NSF attachment protein [Dissophora ornata]